jgi:hypothetical protein
LEESVSVLSEYAGHLKVPKALAGSWLEHARPEVRELGAVQLIRTPCWLIHALNVLLDDGKRELIARLEQESAEPQLLKQVLAYVQLGRYRKAPSQEALRDVARAGSPYLWRPSKWTKAWREGWEVLKDLAGASPEELPDWTNELALTQLMVTLLLEGEMWNDALGLLPPERPEVWDMLLGVKAQQVLIEDKRARRKLAETFAQLSHSDLRWLIRRMPVSLATAWARSNKTPRFVRLEAAWMALYAPDFDPKDCNLSDDAWLVAGLFEKFDRAGERPISVLEVLLRAAVNLLVRRHADSMSEEHLEACSRVRMYVRQWVLMESELGAKLARTLREDLADRIWNALREVHHDGKELIPSVQVVEAWLNCASVLRDRRLLDAVERLEPALRDPERAALAEALQGAKEDLKHPPLENDSTVVVLALKEL